MSILAAIKLIIAMCVALKIRPEDLAMILTNDKATQKYYDTLISQQEKLQGLYN